MNEDLSLTPAQIAKMVKQRLTSLQLSGVDWLPMSKEPVVLPLAAQTSEQFQEPQLEIEPDEARRHELELLDQEVAKCERCPNLASTRTQTVFGVGPLSPELCFVGEAPGADEDAEGKPFVGAAGQLLTRIITAMGMKREEVYVCNTVKCRPPGNRTPRIEEAENCRGYLERQLELIQPKFLCALGGTAAKYLLGVSVSVGRLRQRLHDYCGVPVVVTYHPAYMLPHRNDNQQQINDKKRLVWEDMKYLLAQMGRPIE